MIGQGEVRREANRGGVMGKGRKGRGRMEAKEEGEMRGW